MRQYDLFIENDRLFEELSTIHGLTRGYKEVRRNKGAAGVDMVTVEDFANNLQEELSKLQQELRTWTYKPQPVRAVEIPKPGSNDKRQLGIPSVRDRVVQAALKGLLEPLLEPTFSENSYGFRPGRSQHDAVLKAREIVQGGRDYVVDLDLEKFFNRINHDRLIARLATVVPDKRILRLIGMMLRSGIMKDGLYISTEEGSVQGSPLSPLLSNVVLDELDKALESRGHKFCRFADDSNIFVESYKAAQRVMENISKFIEKRLKLRVNKEKSKVAKSDEVKFLGFTIVAGTIAISKVSIGRAMQRVKALIPRGTHLSLEQSMDKVNKWYRGWSTYYSLTNYPAQLNMIEGHIRRRYRARIVTQHKRRKHLAARLIKMGVKYATVCKAVYSNKGVWKLSHTAALDRAFDVKWFTENHKQYVKSPAKLKHWFNVDKWIRLT